MITDYWDADGSDKARPLRVVGIPVALAKSRFILETPSARFQEKLSPGIFIFDLVLQISKVGLVKVGVHVRCVIYRINPS